MGEEPDCKTDNKIDLDPEKTNEKMSREDFVIAVFELAARYEFCANSAAMAVKMGDRATTITANYPPLRYSQALADICAYSAGEFYEDTGQEEILEDWYSEDFSRGFWKVFSSSGYNLRSCMTLIDVMTEISGREVSMGTALWLALLPQYLAMSPRTWLLTLPALLGRKIYESANDTRSRNEKEELIQNLSANPDTSLEP